MTRYFMLAIFVVGFGTTAYGQCTPFCGSDRVERQIQHEQQMRMMERQNQLIQQQMEQQGRLQNEERLWNSIPHPSTH